MYNQQGVRSLVMEAFSTHTPLLVHGALEA